MITMLNEWMQTLVQEDGQTSKPVYKKYEWSKTRKLLIEFVEFFN